MEMPAVNQCAATGCAYNQQQTCHALAITIGDGQDAHCDTFFGVSFKGGVLSSVGKVGACKVSSCRHNVDLECQAPGIDVGYAHNTVDCLTFDLG